MNSEMQTNYTNISSDCEEKNHIFNLMHEKLKNQGYKNIFEDNNKKLIINNSSGKNCYF